MLGSLLYATAIAICSLAFIVISIDQWWERRFSAVVALLAGLYLWFAGIWILIDYIGGKSC